VQETQNIKVVQDAYAAFGRGDVQSILDRLTDDIVWKPVYGAAAHVPTSGERRGKPGVATFFKQVGESINFVNFDPKEFIATGDKVVALGYYTGKSPLGKTFDSDFAMVFTLKDGKVSHFQEFSDSAAINAAFATVASAV
jgi:ketosteroid isomerase-like protein